MWVRQPFCISSDEEEDDDEVELDDNNKVPIVNKDEEEEEEDEEEEENDANCEDQPKVHLKTETPLKSKVFANNFCGKTYTLKQGLDSHKAGSHLGGIVCPAVGCEQRYTSIKGLVKHVGKIHNTAIFKCNVCDLNLDSYNLLKIHKQEHDSKKTYVCRLECGRQFTHSGDCNKHATRLCPKFNVKKEHGTPAKQSSSANLLLLSAAAAKVSPLHSPPSPNMAKCSFCGKVFETKALMHKHVEKHK